MTNELSRIIEPNVLYMVSNYNVNLINIKSPALTFEPDGYAVFLFVIFGGITASWIITFILDMAFKLYRRIK